MKEPEYQTCEPVGCPTIKPSVTESRNTTSNETSEEPNIIDVIPPKEIPITRESCKDGYTFKLVELVSIGIGIIASCLLIIAVIVWLMIRRDRHKNDYSPNAIRKTKSQPLLEASDTLDSNSRESCA